MSNENNAAIVTVSDAKFNANVKAWGKTARKVRDESGVLTVQALQALANGNVQRLNTLLKELVGVRSFDSSAFVRFCLFHTGGGHMQSGVVVEDASKSVLNYSVSEVEFSIKKAQKPTKAELDGLTPEQATEARETAVKKHQAKLTGAAARAGRGEWWMFSAEKPASPYKLTSLASAIKRAMAERGNLKPEEAKLAEAVYQAAIDAGLNIEL